MTKQAKAEKNIKYAREQIERFLWHEYRIKYPIEVYGHKRIEGEGFFSKLEFKDGKPSAIDISYNLLIGSKRERILLTSLREAVKIALWYRRKPYGEGDKEYETELKKYGLPRYGGLSQTGKELHTYSCSSCEKVFFLREKKLPKSKDVSEQNIYTSCCKAKFQYAGKIHYTNKQLQVVMQQRSKRGGKGVR